MGTLKNERGSNFAFITFVCRMNSLKSSSFELTNIKLHLQPIRYENDLQFTFYGSKIDKCCIMVYGNMEK